MTPFFSFSSLATRVAVLVVVVACPPLLVLGAFSVERNREALYVDAQHYNRALAERARDAIEHELTAARRTMDAITEVLSDPAPLDDESRFALVQAWLRTWERADVVTLYGPDGRLTGSVRLESGKGVEVPPVLPEALRGATFTTGVVIRTMRGPVLQIATPALREGEAAPLFWVYVEFPLGALNELVASLGEQPPLRSEQAVFVVDAAKVVQLAGNGELVGRSARDHGLYGALAGTPSFRQALSIALDFGDDDDAMLGALATVPSLGWAVVVQRPKAQAYATLGALEWAVGLAVAAAVLLALLSGVLGAKGVALPLRRLVDAAKKIGARSWLRVDPDISGRADEVGALGRALDDMSNDLQSSEAELVKQTRARATLSRYLPADVVELVVNDPSALKLGGERKFVTVMFADVVGFTKLSETLPPETVVEMLNELFTLSTEIIQGNGGIVDKFLGDCVMAVWGVPKPHPDDARRAVAAAEAMRRWLDVGNRRWKQAYGVEVDLAIGIHTGEVVAGNLGSEKRMDYTVIGDTVNVAARLESSAAPGQILLSESTRKAMGEHGALNELGERTIRGRAKTTRVYEVQR